MRWGWITTNPARDAAPPTVRHAETDTLDYVYDITDDVLTIWGGERDSTSYFRGRFTDDDTNTGEWVYEGGGGYATTMTRITP